MIEELLEQVVVIDFRSQFVAIGTLKRIDEIFLKLRDADLHDLRDTDTSRENYVAATAATGIKRNRKNVYIVRSDVVAISALTDVVDE